MARAAVRPAAGLLPQEPPARCVEPRPLVQTGPQGDSLLACGTRRRRRPSRLERARRREAHWTVAASPPAGKSQEPSFSAAGKYVAEIGCSDRSSLSSHHEFGYSSFSWSARARALVSTPALAAARSSYRPAAKGPREDRRAPAPPFPYGSTLQPPLSSRARRHELSVHSHVNEQPRGCPRSHGHDITP